MHFFGILVGFDYFLDDFGGALGRGYGGHELLYLFAVSGLSISILQ